MATDTLRITSESWDAFKEHSLEAAEAFDEGDPNGVNVYSFAELDDLFNTLSPKRLELIESVVESPADSISELAHRLDRTKAEVSKDVARLEDHDLLQTRQQERGRSKAVECPYDEIEICIPLPRD